MALVEAGIDLAERAHRGFDLARRHAVAGVGDADGDGILGAGTGLDMDPAARIGEFGRVAENVDEDLFQPQRIAIEQRRLGRDAASSPRCRALWPWRR